MAMPGRRAVLALPGALAAAPAAAQQVASLDATLRPYLARHTLPALAAAVVRQGRVVASGAVGLRRWGTTIPVTINDAFHIGSDTKAMTALLLAQLVEQGRLRWDTPMAEAFPDLAGRMTVGLGAATLTQVMSHTSGLPADNDATDKLIAQSFEQPGNLDTVRAWFVGELVRLPLTSPPGTRFSYSNSGYVMLGALVERLTGRT